MSANRPLKLAIVAGEESGDLLGTDLVAALREQYDGDIDLVGIGGGHLQAAGLHSLFDPAEISHVGILTVLRKAPSLLRRISFAARRIVAEKPDCLVTIDVPDFSLRVARRVHAAAPEIPIVHYVSPSVWAWRPGRAAAMKPFVDHVLCLLPFEPDELSRLGGPPGTYVGHRLARDPTILAAREAQAEKQRSTATGPKTLLVLPGSRRSEIAKMMEPFGATVDLLASRGHTFRVLLPTLPHLRESVETAARNWKVAPRITSTAGEKADAFAQADAALAASGTVSLELALARVPFVVGYRTDFLATQLFDRITVWSGCLPNIIADRPVVAEYYNEYARPGAFARHIEQLWEATPMRAAQLAGFDVVAENMQTARPAGDTAAEIVLARATSGRRPQN